jgi:hypothetical protein
MALVPSTPWKYCGMVNRMPSIASTGSVARMTPHVNDDDRNNVRSSRGWPPGRRVNRRSHAKKATSTATPPPIMDSAYSLPQPSWPALMRP